MSYRVLRISSFLGQNQSWFPPISLVHDPYILSLYHMSTLYLTFSPSLYLFGRITMSIYVVAYQRIASLSPHKKRMSIITATLWCYIIYLITSRMLLNIAPYFNEFWKGICDDGRQHNKALLLNKVSCVFMSRIFLLDSTKHYG